MYSVHVYKDSFCVEMGIAIIFSKIGTRGFAEPMACLRVEFAAAFGSFSE